MNQEFEERGAGEENVPQAQSWAASLGDLQTRQEQLIRGVLLATAIVGLVVAAAGSFDSYLSGDLWTIPLYWLSYGLVVLLLLWRGAPFALRAWGLMVLVYVMGFVDFVQDGPSGSARVFLLTLPFLAGIFLGRRASIFALTLSALTMAAFGWAYSAGYLWDPDNPVASDPASWVVGTLTLFMLGTLMVVSLDFLLPRLAAALDESRRLAQELRKQRDRLEHTVEERTTELMRRSTQLETAAQVAQETTVIRDVEQLVEETVHLISDRFGFYHTGIFLVDDTRRYAVLRAASSEGGQRMLARGHRLRVGEVGIVGHVTGRGEPRIALDVGEDAAFFNNPDLPETRSEIALPLRSRGETMGALDVQSVEPNAFSEEDVAVLQTLADQVAVAISNASLFQQAEASLRAERQAYGDMSREAWLEMLRTGGRLGHRYDPQQVLQPEGQWREDMKQALQSGESVPSESETAAAMAVPIKVRGHVIGVLDAHKPGGEGEWSAEELALLETMVDQLGLALDSARLHQDAQSRATQEQVMGEVAARMRATLDLDTVLQTAIREIGDALDMAEVEVRMGESTAQGPPPTEAIGGGSGHKEAEGGSS